MKGVPQGRLSIFFFPAAPSVESLVRIWAAYIRQSQGKLPEKHGMKPCVFPGSPTRCVMPLRLLPRRPFCPRDSILMAAGPEMALRARISRNKSMYKQPSFQAPHVQGAQRAFSGQPTLTPPTPQTLLFSPPEPHPLPAVPTVRQKADPIRERRQSMNGTIEQNTLRFFNNGVTRFKLRNDDPNMPVASCVMFRSMTKSLPPDLLSVGKRLEVQGFSRQNNWEDKHGNTHVDMDFVVVFMQAV